MFSKLKLGRKNTNNFRKNIPEFQRQSKDRSERDNAKYEALRSWWNALKGDYSLVHTISSDGGVSGRFRNFESPLMQTGIEKLFVNWDVVSTSAMSYYRNMGDVLNYKGRGALNIHLDLNVPIQNILGTHMRDVNFPNHAGKENDHPSGQLLDRFALVDKINSGEDKFGIKGTPYNTLLHFNDFSRAGFSKKMYNEILVLGRPGVSLYHNLPPSGVIRLKKVRYFPANFINVDLTSEVKRQMEKDAIALMKIVKVNRQQSFSFELQHLRLHTQSVCYLSNFLREFFEDNRTSFYTGDKEIFVKTTGPGVSII